MREHRFALQRYSGLRTRFACPSCKKHRTFTRYIDTESGEFLHEAVGRCNRESSCGYHYTPKQYFQDNKALLGDMIIPPPLLNKKAQSYTKQPVQSISYISEKFFKQSLAGYEINNFVIYLKRTFGADITHEAVNRYNVGTSHYWHGATVFWQVDSTGKVRTGKVMLYDTASGRRVKKPFNHITWAHRALKLSNFNLQQCLFGEHILPTEPTMPVALVESEKTALISSIYLPDFLWLATGSLANLSVERCKVLRGRNVVLFPDLNGYKKWSEKAQTLAPIVQKITVSDFLEKSASATERYKGLDLADYLLQSDYRKI